MKNTFLNEYFLETFSLNEVNPDDDFFVLGGSSLLLPQLIHNIWVNTGIHLEARDIFATRSIKKISSLIEEKTRRKKYIPSKLKPLSSTKINRTSLDMSYPQRHVWLSEKLSSLEAPYNVGFTFTIRGNIDINRLKESIEQVIMKEENYNLKFFMESGRLVCETKHFEPDIIIRENVSGAELENYLQESVKIKKFPLEDGPLFEIEIHKLVNEKDTVKVFFLFHHIIIDQYSVPLLWNAIYETYVFRTEYQNPSSFKECILESSEALSSGVLAKQKEYWQGQFRNQEVEKFNKFVQKKINSEYVRMKRVRSKKRPNLLNKSIDNNTAFLTIYLKSVSSHFFEGSENKEFVVGIPYANRLGKNSANCQGFFVNMVPFKVEFSFISKNDYFYYVRQKNEETFENQNYPYELILNEIDFKTPSHRQHFINNVFIYEKQIELKKDGREMKEVSYEELKHPTPMFPLSFYLVEDENQYTINFDFDTSYITTEDATAFLNVIEDNIDKFEVENDHET
ncbi:condensation domain-containing protein [Exiguobacterium sp. s189]|uniref:condensation domain-containing protein n=1 Tax=Exiguobacterium sp. s189 TaxID=2751263 RepID=UPI001BE592E5|nr:condensation domain-containing protein [Exiguobacterium sp. s189]